MLMQLIEIILSLYIYLYAHIYVELPEMKKNTVISI